MWEAIAAGLGILTSLVGWFLFRWYDKRQKKKDNEKRRAELEKSDREKTAELADGLKDRNDSIQKQKQSASDWDPE